MTELLQVIAEVEGVRTPSKTRTKKDLEKIVADHKVKKAVRKTKPAAAKKPAKKDTPAAAAEKPIAEKPAGKSVAPIAMNFVSPTGFVREVAYDETSKLFYVAFAASTWAMPSSVEEWNSVEAAIADPKVDFDTWYRKAFRGRGSQMVPVRKTAEVSA